MNVGGELGGNQDDPIVSTLSLQEDSLFKLWAAEALQDSMGLQTSVKRVHICSIRHHISSAWLIIGTNIC